jgi:hypothetical protein
LDDVDAASACWLIDEVDAGADGGARVEVIVETGADETSVEVESGTVEVLLTVDDDHAEEEEDEDEDETTEVVQLEEAAAPPVWLAVEAAAAAVLAAEGDEVVVRLCISSSISTLARSTNQARQNSRRRRSNSLSADGRHGLAVARPAGGVRGRRRALRLLVRREAAVDRVDAGRELGAVALAGVEA